MDLWRFCVLFSLVSAEKREIEKRSLTNWNDGSDQTGHVDSWNDKSADKTLSTEFRRGGGAIWFDSPTLKLPKTSYLLMNVSSDRQPCQLQINGSLDAKNFELIQNVTIDVGNLKTSKTFTIKKSYQLLRILVRSPLVTKFTIYSINMYHYFCEQITINSTVLTRVDSSTTNISKRVQCSDNAITSDGNSTNITVTCTPKGKWKFGGRKCECNKGFGFKNSECSRCLNDHYKSATGNTKCDKCPFGKTNNTVNSKCECKNDHYIKNDGHGKCYAVPSKPTDLKQKNLNETAAIITWSKPKNDSGLEGSITYTVEVYSCKNQSICNDTAKNTKFPSRLTTTYVVVSNLVLKQEYRIKVISMSNLKNVQFKNWKFEEIKFIFKGERPTTQRPTTGSSEPSRSEKKKNNNIFIYVGAAVAFVVIIVFIIVIGITRNRRGKLKKAGKDNQGFENVPLGQRIYVDPSAYDDPEAALKDFANEISEKNLNLERVIGGGEFGDVYKGILKTEDRGDIEVAVKTLKFDSDERSRKDFFLEGSAMGQFDDPNVIHLEGVITKSIPHMIVIEYMSNGSLDNFLKQNDGELTELQLVGMARGVASGMKYLAAMNFIHRDLAARNILVNEGMLCKVADFGLSRELENADASSPGEYCASGGKIPVRWTAPEAMIYRKFSTASDVWSYGILLWEIMSFAERPYWDWDNFKVLERVDEGYRLPAPKNCPKAVHDLMLLCWETNRENRPDFAAIVNMLDEWIRSPETIRYEKPSKRPVSGSGVNDPAMLIKEWLHDIKMSSYIPHFTQAGFTQLSDLAGLQDRDLQAIGVSLIGHRNKMLRTIRSLPITEETKKTPWNRAASLKV